MAEIVQLGLNTLREEDRIDSIRAELEDVESTPRRRAVEKFFIAALGSIPWVGGFVSAMADYKNNESTARQDSLQNKWLEEHQQKLHDLQGTLEGIGERFEKIGDQVDDLIEDPEYLNLVRKAFRTWDEADTKEKRRYVVNLITNAAGTRLCSDDIIRLFLDWLNLYHEVHLATIREIYKNPGSSRYEIWSTIYGDLPREDSAEADLFKLMIRDLSTGGVIRQERETNAVGQFVRNTPRRTRPVSGTPTMESAFEDQKPYILTALGKQFVHYTMNEVVSRLE